MNILETRTFPAKTLLPWFWTSYVRARLPLLLISFVFMVIEGSALGLLSYMVRPMFDNIFIAGDRSAIFWVSLGVFVLFIFRALSGMAQRILTAKVARTVSAAVQNDLVRHVLTLDGSFFQINPPGVLIARVQGDPEAAANMSASVFSSVGRDVVALISLLSVAVYIDWLWTLIAIVGLPLLFFPIILLQKLVRETNREALNASARINTRLDELFHGINTVKLNGIEFYESTRFGQAVKKLVDAQLKAVTASAGLPAIMDIVAAIGFLGVLSYGGLQIIDGEKTVGEFMSFFTAIALTFEPLRRLGALSASWQTTLISLERVYSVLQVKPNIVSPATPAPLPAEPATVDLVFNDVSFSYGDQPVLQNTSFTAQAGKTTALVGASGAGKSTVFNLLTRMADPMTGQITIGGTVISQFDLKELRGLFSVVTQDAQLFDESIRDNVLLGNTYSETLLKGALDTAHVTDFLPSQDKGLDTPVGPRGSALSGGQRQRVAIGRAVLRNTPILLLDEATSALDTKSEKIVQAALEKLSQGRTTLVIAHRLSTVRNADKIVVMDSGRVVEQGTHDELIKADGAYATLYQLQFSEESGPV